MIRQQELLTILSEESAEVIQVCSKIQRFGFEKNKERLVQELGDWVALMHLTCQEFGITEDELEAAYNNKLEKLKEWSNLFDKQD